MILKGDCIEVMKAMKPNSVDAVVTDPPYGLEFMGKDWDRLTDYHGNPLMSEQEADKTKLGKQRGGDDPFIAKGIRYSKDMSKMQLWHTQWLTEAYRVLKPGGSMLVMGGTRTSHRLACAIEDSGFIIKDTLMWIYGSGFPKAQDLGKMIDKRYRKIEIGLDKLQDKLNKKRIEKGLTLKDINRLFVVPENSGCAAHKFCDKSQPQFPTREQMGILDEALDLKGELWGLYDEIEREIIGKKEAGLGTGKTYAFTEKNTNAQQEIDITAPSTDLAKHWDGFKVGGIKPAYEPIIWAVKPPEGSYVDNVLKWGVGAVNVDECRVGTDEARHARKAGKAISSYNASTRNESMYGKDNNWWPGSTKGRFPANIILSHHPECVQVGVKRVKGLGGSGRASDKGRGFQTEYVAGDKKGEGFSGGFVDKDGLETVESWDCHPDCAVRLLDEQSGTLKSGKDNVRTKEGFFVEHGKLGKAGDIQVSYGDSGGASRFFKQCNYGQEEWLCHGACALRQLDEQSGNLPNNYRKNRGIGKDKCAYFGNARSERDGIPYNDSGGASRFFYCAKASRGERNAGLEGMEEKNQRYQDGRGNSHECFEMEGCGRKTKTANKNNHPTVKPIKLFEWLIKLVTREGQTILDPFIGSGTTAIAAHNIDRKCMGIEKEEEYLEIAKRRVNYWENQPKQMEMRV